MLRRRQDFLWRSVTRMVSVHQETRRQCQANGNPWSLEAMEGWKGGRMEYWNDGTMEWGMGNTERGAGHVIGQRSLVTVELHRSAPISAHLRPNLAVAVGRANLFAPNVFAISRSSLSFRRCRWPFPGIAPTQPSWLRHLAGRCAVALRRPRSLGSGRPVFQFFSPTVYQSDRSPVFGLLGRFAGLPAVLPAVPGRLAHLRRPHPPSQNVRGQPSGPKRGPNCFHTACASMRAGPGSPRGSGRASWS